jgi:hypothetical protein
MVSHSSQPAAAAACYGCIRDDGMCLAVEVCSCVSSLIRAAHITQHIPRPRTTHHKPHILAVTYS